MREFLASLFRAPSNNEPPVYCAECGASNPAGSTYCGSCRKLLNP